jgi:hypothetical protein
LLIAAAALAYHVRITADAERRPFTHRRAESRTRINATVQRCKRIATCLATRDAELTGEELSKLSCGSNGSWRCTQRYWCLSFATTSHFSDYFADTCEQFLQNIQIDTQIDCIEEIRVARKVIARLCSTITVRIEIIDRCLAGAFQHICLCA